MGRREANGGGRSVKEGGGGLGERVAVFASIALSRHGQADLTEKSIALRVHLPFFSAGSASHED